MSDLEGNSGMGWWSWFHVTGEYCEDSSLTFCLPPPIKVADIPNISKQKGLQRYSLSILWSALRSAWFLQPLTMNIMGCGQHWYVPSYTPLPVQTYFKGRVTGRARDLPSFGSLLQMPAPPGQNGELVTLSRSAPLVAGTQVLQPLSAASQTCRQGAGSEAK